MATPIHLVPERGDPELVGPAAQHGEYQGTDHRAGSVAVASFRHGAAMTVLPS